MGKRANIRATARATQMQVLQNRAAHLRAQGLIPAWAGPAEAQAYDRAQARAALNARITANDAASSQHRGLWFGLLLAVIAFGLWFASPIAGFIVGLFAFVLLLLWGLSTGIDAVMNRRDANRP